MTKAPPQSEHPPDLAKVRRSRLWIQLSSWLPVLVAIVLAIRVLVLIHENGLELAKERAALEAVKQDREQVRKERDQFLEERTALQRENDDYAQRIQRLTADVAALQKRADDLRRASEVVDPVAEIKSVRIQLANGTPGQRADLLYRKGNDALDRGQAQAAVALFTEAVSEDPTFAPAFTGLGLAAASKHDLASAERYYRLSVDAQPRYAHGWFNLANLNYMRQRYEKALEFVNKTLEIDPEYEKAKSLRREIEIAMRAKQ